MSRDAAVKRGELAEACARYTESLTVAQAIAFLHGILECLLSVGLMLHGRGDTPTAVRLLRATLRHAHQVEHTFPYMREEYAYACTLHEVDARQIAAWSADTVSTLDEAAAEALCLLRLMSANG